MRSSRHVAARSQSLHERLRREARFHIAVQAADDALWARRFAQFEAPVSIRRRLRRDPLAPSDPEPALAAVPDPGRSDTTPGAIYKALHDARAKLRALTAVA